ncbi:MAG: hypothetical protein KDD94_11805 [Calditrichaeota bacterium]|nr:hypothetical protein [Calditrichota bacterium]
MISKYFTHKQILVLSSFFVLITGQTVVADTCIEKFGHYKLGEKAHSIFTICDGQSLIDPFNKKGQIYGVARVQQNELIVLDPNTGEVLPNKKEYTDYIPFETVDSGIVSDVKIQRGMTVSINTGSIDLEYYVMQKKTINIESIVQVQSPLGGVKTFVVGLLNLYSLQAEGSTLNTRASGGRIAKSIDDVLLTDGSVFGFPQYKYGEPTDSSSEADVIVAYTPKYDQYYFKPGNWKSGFLTRINKNQLEKRLNDRNNSEVEDAIVNQHKMYSLSSNGNNQEQIQEIKGLVGRNLVGDINEEPFSRSGSINLFNRDLDLINKQYFLEKILKTAFFAKASQICRQALMLDRSESPQVELLAEEIKPVLKKPQKIPREGFNYEYVFEGRIIESVRCSVSK